MHVFVQLSFFYTHTRACSFPLLLLLFSETLIPRVLWAQRHDTVFLTFEVFEAKEEKIQIEADKVSFAATRGTDGAKFAVELELFAVVDPDASKVNVGHREVALVLKKASTTDPYWPRLLKTTQKMHYIHTDFSKWKDEDEEDEEEGGFGAGGAYPDFGGFQFGANGADGMQFDEDFEEDENDASAGECGDHCEHDHEHEHEHGTESEEKDN